MFLYYITDRKQLSAEPEKSIHLLLERIRMAAECGVDAIQLREKDLTAKALIELGLQAVEVVNKVNAMSASKSRTRILINSRVDVALACGCDGVHLRSDDISAADARAVLMGAGIKQPFIGVSCHSLPEAERASGNGADLAVFGPIFGKVGSDQVAGMEALSAAAHSGARSKSAMRILALGGITLANAAACLDAGAAGIAGIRLFQIGNMRETVSRLRDLKP
jgi:thiamine-phosphate pyrophosphorylase